MRFRVLGDLHGFLRRIAGPHSAVPPKMMSVILQTYQIQIWFQHHHGSAMAKRHCPACGQDRVFTIWNDGKYHCLPCLYRQAWRGKEGPVALEPTPAMMREFTEMWLSFRRGFRDFEDNRLLGMNRTSNLLVSAPPPLCEADDCRLCSCCRPHIFGAEVGKRCFFCLIKDGLRRTKISDPQRATRDRLDDVARAAVAAVRASR
jgi:hypothetical protein